MLLTLAFGALTAFSVNGDTSGELLKQALYAEEIEGDLPAAIERYEQIISDPLSSQDHVVQALYRMGMCHILLGEDKQADSALNRLVSRYPDRTELVEKAKTELDKLSYFDPASLMASDTMIYLELGSPGRQVDTLMKMLDISPTEDPLAPFMRSTGTALPDGPVVGLTRFLNPSMLAEIKKIRSLAFGCPQFDPQGTSSFQCVMHPGESDALRGMIIAGLSVAGMPSEPIEGMTVLQIPNGPGMAYDDKIIIMAYPRERLVSCINHYKGVNTEPSLASGNPTFRRIDKLMRQHNAATLWMDIDTLYNHLQQQAQGLPPSFHMIAGSIGVNGIDDLLLIHMIDPDGIGLEARVNLKEGVSCTGYELIKTPEISLNGLQGVPAAAVGLLSFDLEDSASTQAMQLRQLAQVNGNIDLPAELFDSIMQVTLFALPRTDFGSDMTFHLGLLISCTDAAPILRFFKEVEALDDGPSLILESTDDAVVVALEQNVIDSVKDALADRHSILAEGVLNASLAQDLGASRKLALVSPSGFVRKEISPEAASALSAELDQKISESLEQLTQAMKSTLLVVHTKEHANELVVSAKLTGIPSLSVLVTAISDVQQVLAEAERQLADAQSHEWTAKLEELLNLPPARVVRTASAPVIDGRMDAAWDAAVAYGLTRTIYVNPGPQEELAANCRLLWDNEKLYVLIDVTDSTPVHDQNQIWQFSDGIELYIDATDRKPSSYGDTEYQFGFVWDGDPEKVRMEQGYGRQVHNGALAIETTNKGYRVEASFPWSELGTTPAIGTLIGFEVQVNDNRGRGQRDAKISWHDPYDQAWLNPQYLGHAELVAAE